MNQAQLLQDFESLPPNAQQEISHFIELVKLRYSQHTLKGQPQIGLTQNNSLLAFIETLPGGTYSSEDVNATLNRLRSEWDDA